MAIFEYRALSAGGEMFIGTMEASAQTEVLEHLDRVNATAISIGQKGQEKRSWRERLTPEPGAEDITGLTLDIAMLLKGGVTLSDALHISSQMETRRWLAKLIKQLHIGLSSGKSFSKVLAQYPALFPPIYVKTIEVAEVSGRLEQALSSIASERQRSDRLRNKLVSSLAYPAFLAVAALGVLVFVLLYIIPQFEGAIAGYRDRISPSALFVFRLSEGLRAHFDMIVIGFVLLLLGFIAIKRFGQHRSLWINILAALPLTARVINYQLTLTFCRTLQLLLVNGVDISTSLRLIRGINTRPVIVAKIDAVIASVRGGKRLSQALAVETLLPGYVVQLLRVGEEAGNLAASAGRIADFYETKLDSALAKLTAVAGPVLMMAVSLLIGWLILSIMSALMSINDLLV